MESNHPLSREVLHEDLQILRYTLAAISDDVRQHSPFSAEAVERAITDIDVARYALDGGDGPAGKSKMDRPSRAHRNRAKKRTTDILSPVSFPA